MSNTIKTITAEEARGISGLSVDEHVEYLCSLIRNAAENKKREIIVRSQPYERWLYQKSDSVGVKVVNELKKLGFEVDLYYKELQFVDMGLRIKW